ncbi:ABC transporter permease [Granulicoccus phenolivorans]|uniref:ABC transporter permease n=1 Tax=Granulicoccus phenolivorans TaxID=266854 RepID=UPI000416DD43|nr:ABC transporter permease [Granulicoccus phenolivorans]
MSPFGFLADPANWQGPDGILQRLLEHLVYSGLSLLLAMVVAIPVGIWIGHTRRGQAVISLVVNAARAIPTLGLLVLVVLLLGTGLMPVVLALAILAIPPILNGTVTGFNTADPDAVYAARAVGMTGGQVIGKVELPLAMPLIISGLRSATLQVVATATIAAMAAAGGLGRFVIDGQKRRDGYPEMLAGALLVAVLAIVLDLLWGLIGWASRRRTHQTA